METYQGRLNLHGNIVVIGADTSHCPADVRANEIC